MEQPIWNFEQEPTTEALDETGVNLRAYFDRVDDVKLQQYRPDWTNEQVIEWDGNFKDDGTLFNRRTWADVKPVTPDGICLDAEGAIWIASPVTAEFVRVREGGEITHRIPLGDGKAAYACMLGGEDGKTLFLCTSEGTEQDRVAGRSRGWIETVRVDVPRAGRP